MPEKVRELSARLDAWRKDVGAKMPTPNDKYDATKPSGRAAARPGGKPAAKKAGRQSPGESAVLGRRAGV
jgi:hypothetical protein